MKKICLVLLLLNSLLSYSQTDYSKLWEDFYSYNNAKQLVKTPTKIFAATDNAVFSYDFDTDTTQKFSSVNGLSGKTVTSIYFDENKKLLIIGYDTGLIEIVDKNNNVSIINDIERLTITGDKQINQMVAYNDKLYLATSFAIVVFDLNTLQFGDTYFIGNGSAPIYINQIAIYNNRIYAATKQGVLSADINNPNLIDFNNWIQPQGNLVGDFSAIAVFNNELLISKNNNLYSLSNATNLNLKKSFSSTIIDIKSSSTNLAIVLKTAAFIFDTNLIQVAIASTNANFNFSLHSAYAENQDIYLATSKYGILKTTIGNSSVYKEIHPDGPNSNKVFSITEKNKNLWVVYGAYDGAYTPLGKRLGFSHFNGTSWTNVKYNPLFPAINLVHVTIDPLDDNTAYISSWGSGMLVVKDNQIQELWNQNNSGLESLIDPASPNYKSIRINGSAFDSQGNLWVTNSWVDNKLKKRTPSGLWTSYNLNSLITETIALGLNQLVIDKLGNKWIGTRRNGALVFNENGNKKIAFSTDINKGNLPDINVRTIAVDHSNRIWLGTNTGLVVYNGGSSMFTSAIYKASPIIILDEGIAKRLLGEQSINTIAVDGADNKWFGTDNGGVLNTNPDGTKTIHNFNKDNSPLPSNRILKIEADQTTGKIYFATDKGIVAFNSKVTPYGNELKNVYAYPNPVRKNNDFVTIDGRNGTHLPKGTNVKIVDAAGNLVFETNVKEGQTLQGGKVVWDKTNLAGHKVASGVYIVLLTNADNSESTTTKIAIIN